MRCIRLVLGLIASTGLLIAQDARAPFDAAWVAFPETISIVDTGDFDGDGDIDAVGWRTQTTTDHRPSVHVYANDGSGNYAQVSSYGPYNQFTIGAWDLCVGQLDAVAGDDWIAAFGPQVVTATGQVLTLPWDVKSMELLDFDGDGFDDLAVLGNHVWLYRNDQNGGFTMQSTLSVSPSFRDLKAIDAGQSSGVGLVVMSPVSVLVADIQNGTLGYGPSMSMSALVTESPTLTTGDIDGDQDDDIVVFLNRAGGVLFNGEYIVFRRAGPTTFVQEARQVGGPATDLEDINGDGYLDGTCCGSGGPSPTVYVQRSTYHVSVNDGTGRFAAAWAIGGVGARRLAGCEDVDGDGDKDLIAGRTIFFNQSGFTCAPQPPGQSSPIERAAHDQDGDGDPDLQVGWASRLDNDGTGTTREVAVVGPAIPDAYGKPAIGDFDGDGDLDLIVHEGTTSSVLGMRLLRNNGGGGYTDAGMVTAPGVVFSSSTHRWSTNWRSLVADIDGDNDQDVLVSNPAHDVLRIWANDGGSFTLRQTLLGEVALAVRDLDSDGHADLVTDRGVRFGSGQGTVLGIEAGTSLIVAIDGQLGIGDLDNDGDQDIAYCDLQNDDFHVLWNAGGRSFVRTSHAIPLTLSSEPTQQRRLAVTDADTDGNLDVLVGPTALDAYSTIVMFGDGIGSFPIWTQQAFELGPLFDAEGDGDLDVLGPRITRALRYRIPADGMREQYGHSTPGLGGMHPTLGATGPFRAGHVMRMNLRGAPGGALALLVLGIADADAPGVPLPNLHMYVSMTALLTVAAGGPTGVAGAGSFSIPFPIPAAISGFDVYHQAFVIDPSVAEGASQTGGLVIRYR